MIMNPNPAHEPKEQTPESAQSMVPKDHALVNVVFTINESHLPNLPAQVHW